ncbi:hypothetical protein ALP83_100896 [Pseudomonas syringae pv. actinidiae]|uniref:Uncharacterized protein n=1 Tax=Pseudomonas syringae pv. actinidiae TaxID=103796 RepID=A0A7Z6UKK7_PSESF|nr:hypothetical protein ALP83_100896 [Pseudomonas syringae pv. actinidiae]
MVKAHTFSHARRHAGLVLAQGKEAPRTGHTSWFAGVSTPTLKAS